MGLPCRRALAVGLGILAWAGAAGPVPAATDPAEAAYRRGELAEALRLWKARAERNDPEAAYRVARMVFLGEGVAQDVERAEHWLTRAAVGGHREAGYLIGKRKGKPLRWLRARAAEGDLLAQYYLARRSPKAPEAVRWGRSAAAAGIHAAEFLLGKQYFRSDPAIPKEEAAAWLHRAGEAGVEEAFFPLGELYFERGGEKDFTEAARWYRRCAERGESLCVLRMGSMHQEGIGVPRDDVEAYAWFGVEPVDGPELDAQMTHTFRVLRRMLARRMTPEQIERAEALTRGRQKSIDARAREREP